jgi:hypothetical protein
MVKINCNNSENYRKAIHVLRNCNLNFHTYENKQTRPRCVKCAGRHLTIECQKLETQNPKCVNFGEGHPANYRGCIVAKELQKIKNKKAMKGKPVKI